jgi:hypothetical protein
MIKKDKINLGDLLMIDTHDGRNAIVWSICPPPNLSADIEVVDSLEAGDFCLCIDAEAFFEDYIAVLTHNEVIGYVSKEQVERIRRC